MPQRNSYQERKMRPLKRNPISKQTSAAKFRSQTKRTKAANIVGPMRGGIRL